jgi:hypothetical protein
MESHKSHVPNHQPAMHLCLPEKSPCHHSSHRRQVTTWLCFLLSFDLLQYVTWGTKFDEVGVTWGHLVIPSSCHFHPFPSISLLSWCGRPSSSFPLSTWKECSCWSKGHQATASYGSSPYPKHLPKAAVFCRLEPAAIHAPMSSADLRWSDNLLGGYFFATVHSLKITIDDSLMFNRLTSQNWVNLRTLALNGIENRDRHNWHHGKVAYFNCNHRIPPQGSCKNVLWLMPSVAPKILKDWWVQSTQPA